MSLIKRYIEACEAEEAMTEWIRAHADLGVEPGDDEWEDLKAEYLSRQVVDDDYWEDEFFQDEVFRLESENYAFCQFSEQMNELIGDITYKPSDSALKMNYSYSITLMETCLGDMIKSLILKNKYFFENAIKNVDELKKEKLSLRDVYQNPDIVKTVVIRKFSDYLYHNIEKTVQVYSAVLGEKIPDNVMKEIPEICKIALIRHDIVHRNGSDKDGKKINLNKEILLKALGDISNFVKSMSVWISTAECNLQKRPLTSTE
ncbi:hypothetical protein AB5T01_004245 [Escherichia albertii]